MAELGESVRVTRAAVKRAAETAFVPDDVAPANKKRVVLGELTNLSNMAVQDLGPRPRMILPKIRRWSAQPKKEASPPREAVKVKEKVVVAVPVAKIDVGVEEPLVCGDYESDIYEYLYQMEMEQKRRPSPDYLETVQKDITPNMRGILVDWLVEVAEEYKVLPETFYLTVAYVDRFLSLSTVTKQKLQLLGVSSMLIASKYEEITPPSVDDFCYITDNTYTKDEIVAMEADVLKILKFEMGNPTVKTFLSGVTKTAQESYKSPNPQLEFLGQYLAELSVLDYNCVKFLPSLVAASVIFLARFMIKPKVHPWTTALQQHSRYKASELKDCVLIIHDLYMSRRGAGLQAVREKYKQNKFKCVATMPSPPEIPASFFEDVSKLVVVALHHLTIIAKA